MRTTEAAVLAVVVLLSGAPTPQAPLVTFDRYHGHRDLKAALDRIAAARPELARVASIGADLRGFDLWLIEITNTETGAAADKPAVFAIGNLDGDEPIATESLLALAQRAVAGHGADAALTTLLDTTVLYLVPMANPFMADQYVTTPLRGPSGVNARPRDDDRDQRTDEDGPEDLDGDGHILTMRVRAPSGPFRTDPADPRLLVRRAAREPGEWITYTEGIDNDRDGRINEDPIGGVTLDRNFPFDWKPEAVQEGAGAAALSEPEVRAIAEFLTAHANVGLVIDARGGSSPAQVLRPYAARPDAALPPADLDALTAFVAPLDALPGGAPMRSPHGAIALSRAGRLEYGFGVLIDWASEQHGAFAVAPELGLTPGDADGDGEVSDRELLQLSDREFGGRLFVPWKPFAHPTLGRVEIGGFVKFARDNPPAGAPLERAARAWAGVYAAWASRLPRLQLDGVTTVAEHGGITIRATVENAGALPTNVTTRAVAQRSAAPVVVTLTVSPGVELLGDTARLDIGALPGRDAPDGSHRRELVWAVRLPADAQGTHWAEIVVSSVKAGTVRRRVALQ